MHNKDKNREKQRLKKHMESMQTICNKRQAFLPAACPIGCLSNEREGEGEREEAGLRALPHPVPAIHPDHRLQSHPRWYRLPGAVRWQGH